MRGQAELGVHRRGRGMHRRYLLLMRRRLPGLLLLPWLPGLLRRHLAWLTRLSRLTRRIARSVLYCWRGERRAADHAWRHARDVHRRSRDHAVL